MWKVNSQISSKMRIWAGIYCSNLIILIPTLSNPSLSVGFCICSTYGIFRSPIEEDLDPLWLVCEEPIKPACCFISVKELENNSPSLLFPPIKGGKRKGGPPVKNPAAETAGRQKLNICFQCHSRLSGILPTVRDRKKDSGQARMTEIRNCGRDHRV